MIFQVSASMKEKISAAREEVGLLPFIFPLTEYKLVNKDVSWRF